MGFFARPLYVSLPLLLACQSVQTPDDGKAWGEPEPIGNLVDAYKFIDLSVDPEGNAAAVWTVEETAGQEDVASNRYSPGVGWGAPEPIEINSGAALFPRVAMDGEGNAVVVWHQSNGTRLDIWSNRYTPTDGWGPAERIDRGDTDARRPEVAMDLNGNTIAVWYQSDGERENIWSNRYTAIDGWGTAGLIESNEAGDARWPQIAMDPNGTGLTVWQQCYAECDFDDPHEIRWNIWSNRYTPAEGWGTHRPLTPDNAGDAIRPRVAMDASGNAVAVWQQSDAATDRFSIWSNRYDVTSGWGTAELIEFNDAGDASRPEVAMDPAGTAVAVWSQFDGTSDDVWSNRYTADGGWDEPERIEANDTGQATRPRVAMDPSGSAVVVWTQSHGMQPSVWSNRYTPSSGWGAAEPVEDYDGSRVFEPHVAMDANGNAVAIWTQGVGAHDQVWSNRLTWRDSVAEPR